MIMILTKNTIWGRRNFISSLLILAVKSLLSETRVSIVPLLYLSLVFFFSLPFRLKGVFNGDEINLGTHMKRCNIIKRDIYGRHDRLILKILANDIL